MERLSSRRRGGDEGVNLKSSRYIACLGLSVIARAVDRAAPASFLSCVHTVLEQPETSLLHSSAAVAFVRPASDIP